MLRDRIAFAVLGTPLAPVAEAIRSLQRLPHRLRHPELAELHREPGRMAELMRRLIRRETNCIDVGAHLGSVLREIVRLAPGGHHLAVEPVPHQAAWLRRRFTSVEVHQAALCDQEGTTEFWLDRSRSGYSGLTPSPNAVPIQVPCRRLDDLIPTGHRIGFIKIDVEGHESSVLRGARRVISDSQPVILFECGPLVSHENAARLFGLLVGEIGYDVFLIRDWLAASERVDFERFERVRTYPFEAFNFVAAPRS